MRNKLIVIVLSVFSAIVFNARSQTTRKYVLVMRSNVGTATMWDNTELRIYGFSPALSTQPTLPGVTLYAEEGDSIYIEARAISQGHEHTLHLHGFDSSPKHDGDPLTSHPIGHLQSRIYAYKATSCGTFIYHCHVEDVVHVQMGMYGLLIVKPKGGGNNVWTGGPSYSKEYSWLMSEIDRKWHDNIPVMLVDTLKVPLYKPNYFLINGKSEQQITADDSIKITGAPNEVIFLRTANIGYYRNRIIFPSELNATMVDSDGRPLPHAIESDTVDLMPGERIGVLLKCASVFSGNIRVSYINMNSDSVWNTQKVPVDIGVSGVKENDLVNSLVIIYPNPASNIIEIVLNDKNDLKNQEYAIINAIGQIVAQGQVIEDKTINTFSIDVSSLKNGVYYVRLLLKDQFLHKKVVITK